MLFSQRHDPVQAFALDREHKSLRVSVQPLHPVWTGRADLLAVGRKYSVVSWICSGFADGELRGEPVEIVREPMSETQTETSPARQRELPLADEICLQPDHAQLVAVENLFVHSGRRH